MFQVAVSQAYLTCVDAAAPRTNSCWTLFPAALRIVPPGDMLLLVTDPHDTNSMLDYVQKMELQLDVTVSELPGDLTRLEGRSADNAQSLVRGADKATAWLLDSVVEVGRANCCITVTMHSARCWTVAHSYGCSGCPYTLSVAAVQQWCFCI